MRASKHQRVDARLSHGREQALGQHVHLIGFDVALFDEFDESRAGRARELETGIELRRRPLIGTRRDGPHRSDHTDPTDTGRALRGAHAGLDDAHDRHVETLPQMIERDGGRAVARDHDHSDVVFEQQIDDLERVLQDLVGGFRAVRKPPGVAEIDDVGAGNEVEQCPDHREAAESAVEDADRPVVVHHKRS